MATYSPSQTGLSSAGVWFDWAVPIPMGTSINSVGLQYTPGLADLTHWTSLTLEMTVAASGPAEFQLWCPVRNPSLAAWSTSNLPDTLFAQHRMTLVGQALFSNMAEGGISLPPGIELPPGISLPSTGGVEETRSVTLETDSMNALARQDGWNGTVGLVLTLLGGPTSVALSGLTLTGVEETVTFVPGYMADRAVSRPDACPRCGTFSLREQWVRDGFNNRLVCPDCWDPPDPQKHLPPRRRERPLVNEGA